MKHIDQRFPKWGPWVSSISLTWELVSNSDSQVPPQTPLHQKLEPALQVILVTAQV